MDDNALARVAALISNPSFKAFMVKNKASSCLLVNGNEDLASIEGLSPLSLVAAKLVQISEQTESSRSMTLRYFCAEHGPYSGERTTSSPAASMMVSLTCQLVTNMLSRSLEPDLSFLDPKKWTALKTKDLKVVCTVFYELVKQLPPKTALLCVLDEVALYETGPSKRDVDIVIRRLVRLVEGCGGITFKMLVTCRGRAMGIGTHFAGHVLEMDEDVEAEDSSAWQVAAMGSPR